MKRNRAVMEDRAPAKTEDEDPRRALWRKLEWFATPPWGTRAGAEIIRELDPAAVTIWEPCAGDGIMAEVLREYFPIVYASDIHPQGPMGAKLDFLDPYANLQSIDADWIMFNPPFGLSMQFMARARCLARRGIALLGRFGTLECEERFEPLYVNDPPLTMMAPFIERLPMQLGPWNPEAGTATGYAWFFFMRDRAPLPIRPIPPGTRRRLWKQTDARRFGLKREAPLFDALTE